MFPFFSRGDAVLIEKISENEFDSLKVDEVLAFKYNNKILVHRIISINENNGIYLIKTKGDNNISIDAWTVNNDMIYGKVISTIKYIGIPSVELSERLN